MKQAIKLASITVFITALASLALCQETRIYREGSNWVQELSGDLAGARNLRVKLASGSVQIKGGSQSVITYVIHRKAYTSSEQQARREFESYRLSALLKGDTAWIVSESGGQDRRCSDDLLVNVPQSLQLAKIETGGGSVNATGIAGRVELESGGGSIHADNVGGGVVAETGGGAIDLGQLGGSAEIETGAGSIRLASAKGRVRAQTGGGSIQLDGASSVQAETSAGGIVVKLLSSEDLPRNDSTLETSAGDITVYLVSDLAISVRAEIEIANGHTIRSDFSDIRVSSEGGPWEKTVRAEGQLNGGGPVLKVRTNSGNVTFRRVNR